MSTPIAKLMQIRDLLNASQFEAAYAQLQRIIKQYPNDGPVNNAMAICLSRMNAHVQAEFFARRSVDAAPTDAASLSTCGNTIAVQHKYKEAIPFYERSLKCGPDNPHALLGLSNCYNGLNEPSKAAELLRRGVELYPQDPMLAATLGSSLQLLARPAEALATYRLAAQRFPGDLNVLTALAFASNFAPGVSRDEAFGVHKAYDAALRRSVPHPPRTFKNDRSPSRTLRVGILSPDFRQHSVSFFLDAIYEKLDRSAFELYSYYNTSNSDAVTARFKSRSSEWRQVHDFNDATLAHKINADRIDILFDTTGHTHGHKLAMFLTKPAPIQIAYCGYPNTTGLAAIDYRIVDSFTDPAGAEAFHSEKLVRLDPCFLCFTPPKDPPAVGETSSDPHMPIRFGSFNATSKMSELTLDLWSRVLAEVPDSTLTLKAVCLGDEGLCRDLEERFASRGIDRERLKMIAPTKTQAEHLTHYQNIDIGLDPFPYHGTTTTCDALLMGVPVVSLAGDRHASRVGVSLLSNTGLGELIAHCTDEYVKIAAGLATNRARRAAIRSGLRERFLASPVCDAAAFAHRLGTALRTMWRHYCEAHP
jgi:protein O-GlcNAc transferase